MESSALRKIEYEDEFDEFYEELENTRRRLPRRLRQSRKFKLERRQNRYAERCRVISVVFFLFTLFCGMLLGFMSFLRPVKSDVENRMLTRFPVFSAGAFMDGSYFSSLSVWYADTFPMRDRLIAMDRDIKGLYGLRSDVMMMGGNESADEIPDIAGQSVKKDAVTMSATTETAVSAAQADVKNPVVLDETVEIPTSSQMEEEIKKQISKGLYVKKDAAYTIYYFNRDSVESYANTLETAAEQLADTTQVYNILIPNNSGIMLPEDELKKLGGSNQRQAIEYYYSLYHRVKGVRVFDALKEHNDEYIFFKTDHHWTQRGAYYAYQEFCKVKGIKSHDLDSFEAVSYSPFLGSFYGQLQLDSMKTNPDVVEAFIPNDTNDMVFWDNNGKSLNWQVVSDVTAWSESTKYSCYIGGDNPLVKIENPKIHDGSSCVIVKESYGNCFVPFLVDHYQTIYVMDFRYYKNNITDFCREHKIKDLIVMNNITIISPENVANLVRSQYLR